MNNDLTFGNAMLFLGVIAAFIGVIIFAAKIEKDGND